ncbi:MAG: hypothetical protein ACJA1H_000086 [Glaciecola sp.]|jgi:hypothetical protein
MSGTLKLFSYLILINEQILTKYTSFKEESVFFNLTFNTTFVINKLQNR